MFFPFNKNLENSGNNKSKRIAVNKLKIWIKTNALKMFDFDLVFSAESGKRAFNNPFNQKKLTAPARNTNVSYSPIALCVKAVLVNTTPINIKVEYLTNW